MAELGYNNIKNASTGHTLFKLNYSYHSQMFYEKDIDPRSRSRIAKKLSSKLCERMIIYQKNLYHAQ